MDYKVLLEILNKSRLRFSQSQNERIASSFPSAQSSQLPTAQLTLSNSDTINVLGPFSMAGGFLKCRIIHPEGLEWLPTQLLLPPHSIVSYSVDCPEFLDDGVTQ